MVQGGTVSLPEPTHVAIPRFFGDMIGILCLDPAYFMTLKSENHPPPPSPPPPTLPLYLSEPL